MRTPSRPPFNDIAATYIGFRTPQWKLHRLGMAKRAISYYADGRYGNTANTLQLWFIVDDGGKLDWKLLFDGDATTTYEELPWVKNKKWPLDVI